MGSVQEDSLNRLVGALGRIVVAKDVHMSDGVMLVRVIPTIRSDSNSKEI